MGQTEDNKMLNLNLSVSTTMLNINDQMTN